MRYGIAFRLKMLDNRIRRAMDARTRIHESGSRRSRRWSYAI